MGLRRRGYPVAFEYFPQIIKPMNIMHKITLRCNARCRHCDIWKMKKCNDIDELSTEEIKKLYKTIRKWSGRVPIVITGGESLLRDDALSLAKYAVDIGLVVEFLSNGYLMTEEKAKELVQTGVDRITISLDGISAEVVNDFRGHNDYYECITSAINNLTKYRKKYKKKVVILIKTVVMKNNINELPGLASWASKSKVRIRFQPIEQNYGQKYMKDWYIGSELWPNDIDRVEKSIKELIALKEQGYPIDNNINELQLMIEYFSEPENIMRDVKAHNAVGKKVNIGHLGNLEINPDGKLVYYEDEEVVWGDIRKQDLLKLWKDFVFRERN